jgi:SAM-dependent methyltransferase
MQPYQIILFADYSYRRKWVFDAGIPQAIKNRLTRLQPVTWLGVRLDESRLETHRKIDQRGFRSRLGALRRRLFESDEFLNLPAAVAEDAVLPRLVEQIKTSHARRLVLVRDDAVAVSVEAVNLMLRLADESGADVVYSSQFLGLLPVVVSAEILEWVGHANYRRLFNPTALAQVEKSLDVQLVDPQVIPGSVRCYPIDGRDDKLVRFWEKHQIELEDILRKDPHKSGSGRQSMEALIHDYRENVASGLETYHIVGELHDIDRLRRQFITSKKPLIDYFVISTHYVRFLQQYAGLKPDSHFIDIGCNWGYLGFALANYLKPDGCYLGVDVQKQAIDWAKELFGWLGPNFNFMLLDIYNDYYNPTGKIPRGQVKLEVEDNWADLTFAASVFTHMQEDGLLSYFKEYQRVLKPGGIAAFSYDDSSFFASGEEAGFFDRNMPDRSTYYSRAKVRQLIESVGMVEAHPPVNLHQFQRSEYQTWYFAKKV